jgi:formiminotetrahydrofolate cyclodeaminase
MLELADRDAAAYGRLNRLMKDKAANEDERREAAIDSTEVPIEIMSLCAAVADRLAGHASLLNAYLRSDALIAAETLMCFSRAALRLVLANEPELERMGGWQKQRERADAALQQAASALQTLSHALDG